jgi:hypothetical protein
MNSAWAGLIRDRLEERSVQLKLNPAFLHRPAVFVVDIAGNGG